MCPGTVLLTRVQQERFSPGIRVGSDLPGKGQRSEPRMRRADQYGVEAMRSGAPPSRVVWTQPVMETRSPAGSVPR